MQLVETTIAGSAVRMRFADHADLTKAIEWVEFQVLPQFAQSGQPIDPNDLTLNSRLLVDIRQVALQRALEVVGDELQRLQKLADRLP